jgi:hypothetical protein
VVTEVGRHSDTTWFPGAKWLFENVLAYFLKTCEQGAQTTIYCAVSEEVGKETGLYYRLDLVHAACERELTVLQVRLRSFGSGHKRCDVEESGREIDLIAIWMILLPSFE